jgi:hypothetical protein
MGALYTMGSFTGATTGTIQGMDYSADFFELTTAVSFLTGAVNALTIALDTNMLGVTASTVPGTLANSAKGATIAFQSIAGLNVDGSKKSVDLQATLGLIAKQLSGLSGTIAAGVATNQIIAADQIKKNAFDKEATQAALTRNNLPTVTVTPQSFLTTIQTTVQDASSIAAQASATGFVTSTATKAITVAGDYVYDLLPSVGDITNAFKSVLPSRVTDTEGEAARLSSLTLNTLSKTVTATA